MYFLHNWLIYKVLDREIASAAARYASGRMLDVGCGVKPYREMFAPYLTAHIGMDHSSTIHDHAQINIYGRADSIPFRDRTFDTVLCTEVLEHIEEPGKAVAEMYRVLRAGGTCILTTPFFWHVHEAPRDFFRYTRHGLQYLFERSSFTVLEINPIAGFWVTFAQEFSYYLIKFREIFLLRVPISLLVWMIQRIGYALDKLDKDVDFATEHIVIARKLN